MQMNTQFLLNQLLLYRTEGLTHHALNQILEQMSGEAAERLQKEKRIEDIFLSQLLPWLTTVSEQAYQKEDIDCLIEALQGKRPLSYHCCIVISLDMLSEYEKQILAIAQEYLKEKRYDCLSERNQAVWRDIRARRSCTRMEFYTVETVTEWLAYQIEWLLWIAMSKL